ncbi:manganese-dependent ADP-ribose/CDP-alcohol diphosphatase isoform X1 [Scyliorhinus canicula]|uniref:manganese-dependent ADP-ribose/CDP-alcohol diphosphatase isoform X1 n=2 Tax=Scyliorhinus canicula TaxID=7830 RepID=UPI0018F3E368|nr:manganese-dependent ADP-ribose/CDP-alcohol diphosphatase isoform X1 [Scyliorhinus canicula]
MRPVAMTRFRGAGPPVSLCAGGRWWLYISEIFKRMEPEAAKNDPYFTFGVIADVQYADTENGFNYSETRDRYYRNSLHLLRSAIMGWNEEPITPRFILQLGDLIDGCNSSVKSADDALQTVLSEFAKCKSPVHHIWGNHEFYNFDRELLLKSALNTKRLGNEKPPDNTDSSEKTGLDPHDPEGFYGYHFSPFPKFRFILTDAYDVSILGRKKNSRKHHDSMLRLKSKNGNENLNSPRGLTGLNLRFLAFNGGFSQEQLEWLNKILTFSDNNQEKVAIIGHLPVHPNSADPMCIPWNYDEILSVLHAHTSIVCFIAGHDHDGGYYLDDHGIHHLTFEGVIETSPESHAFGTIYVCEDRMILKGRGRISDRVLHYRKT